MRIVVLFVLFLNGSAVAVAEESSHVPVHQNVLVLIDNSGSLRLGLISLFQIKQSLRDAAEILQPYQSVYVATWSKQLSQPQVWEFSDTESVIRSIKPNGTTNIGTTLESVYRLHNIQCASVVFIIHQDPDDKQLFRQMVQELSRTRPVSALLVGYSDLEWYRRASTHPNYTVARLRTKSLVAAVERSVPGSGCRF